MSIIKIATGFSCALSYSSNINDFTSTYEFLYILLIYLYYCIYTSIHIANASTLYIHLSFYYAIVLTHIAREKDNVTLRILLKDITKIKGTYLRTVSKL